MAFTATVTAFGHEFNSAYVTVNEANLEYRLNDFENGTESTSLRVSYKVYVNQTAKEAGGEPILNYWIDKSADDSTDIVDGDLKSLATGMVKAEEIFSNIADV